MRCEEGGRACLDARNEQRGGEVRRQGWKRNEPLRDLDCARGIGLGL